MKDLHFINGITRGWTKYTLRFPDDDLSWMDAEKNGWPTTLEIGSYAVSGGQEACCCAELGEYLASCASSGHRATPRGFLESVFNQGPFKDETEMGDFVKRAEAEWEEIKRSGVVF